jgi:hypothetical protein
VIAKTLSAMEAIGHKLFQLGDPEGKGFIVRRDMQVSALLRFVYPRALRTRL